MRLHLLIEFLFVVATEGDQVHQLSNFNRITSLLEVVKALDLRAALLSGVHVDTTAAARIQAVGHVHFDCETTYWNVLLAKDLLECSFGTTEHVSPFWPLLLLQILDEARVSVQTDIFLFKVHGLLDIGARSSSWSLSFGSLRWRCWPHFGFL